MRKVFRFVSLILTLFCFLPASTAQTIDIRVERFISETEPRYLIGVNSTQETPEGMMEARAVARKLGLLPDEALDSALRLLIPERENSHIWRIRVAAFIQGMYRTHGVSPDKHRQISRVVFNEMISPKGRPLDAGEFYAGMDFIKSWGTREDMVMLYPLLNHSDPEVRRLSTMCLQQIANNLGLPDPTVKSPDTPLPSEPATQLTDPSATPSPVIEEKKIDSRQNGASAASPKPVGVVSNGPLRWSLAIGIVLGIGILLAWLVQRRSIAS